MKSTVIYTIANQKGGVGKSSTVLNLGYALSRNGAKVLLIDLDPQASLSVCFGVVNHEKEKNTAVRLFENVLSEKLEQEDIFSCIHSHATNENINIIPCNIGLAQIEDRLRNEVGSEMTLSEILRPLIGKYDYIIYDTSPSLGLLLINALSTSDGVIITVSPQFLSALGLEALIKTINKTRKRVNARLEILGILLTMCDPRTNLYKDIREALEVFYSEHLSIFKTYIPYSTKVGEANLNKQSIIEFSPDNKAGQAYMALALELKNKLHR
ncbi:MAG: ParA family protein [Oscillospiraceae bacterium]|nr:ParA family protein [Oscillospiraceae bacterium]